MKKTSAISFLRAALAVLFINLFALAAMAQESVTIETEEAGSWLSENWMWVAGGVLLLIILLAAGSSRSRRTTTVREDPAGRTTSTTTVVED